MGDAAPKQAAGVDAFCPHCHLLVEEDVRNGWPPTGLRCRHCRLLIGPGRAGLFANLAPVFGALLAVAIIGEPFRFFHFVALVLVVGGILIAETAGRLRASAAAGKSMESESKASLDV